MINTLRKQNETLLNKFKLEGNKELESKHTLISTLLSHDNCFFKLPMDTAINILFDLGYNKQESLDVYKKLISIENFKRFKDSK